MPEHQENSVVQAIERISESTYRLTLHAPLIAAAARPGQFVMAACGPTLDPLLRRPFSIHRILGTDSLQLLFKTIGRGTNLLSQVLPGHEVSLIGPLGRGFRLSAEGPVCLVGGGIGIAPLLFLAHELMRVSKSPGFCRVFLGGRSSEEILPLTAEFTRLGYLVETATDDGTLGHRGLVTDLLPPSLPQIRQVYVCGPHPMMAAVASMCREAGVACQASLEAHMACGLGACLGCTVHGTEVLYRHVCKHGPVFNAEEVAWTR